MSDEATEEWRPVEGWPYEVSDAGRVRRTTNARANTYAGRILRQGHLVHDRYRMVKLSRGPERWQICVHRLVAMAFVPRPEGCDVVNHLDADTLNNRPSNLEWTTTAGNTAHAARLGLYNKGEQVWHLAKLTADSVRAMRAEYAANPAYGMLARLGEKYGVTASAVGYIIRGHTWRHV